MNGDFTAARLDLSDTLHLSISAGGRPLKNNDVRTRNVIENTRPRSGVFFQSRDVIENK